MPGIKTLAAWAHHNFTLATAHAIAPVMRITGLRFSKASRSSRVINALVARVPANLLASGSPVGKVRFW